MQPYMTMDFVRSYPFSGAWRRTAFRGCLALAAAFLLFLFPGTTLNALVIGTGAYLFADGVMMFSFGVTEPRVRVGMFVRGALAVVAGALAVTFSSMTLGALVFALGAWGVFAGCLELMLAYRFRDRLLVPWLWGSAGLVSLGFGILFLVWPEPGRTLLAFLLGVYALLAGSFMLLLATRLRAGERRAAR